MEHYVQRKVMWTVHFLLHFIYSFEMKKLTVNVGQPSFEQLLS
jgi:hypothetical protein